MSLRTRLASLWRNLAHRARVERDLDDELNAAFALLVDEKRRAGSSEAEARRAATLALGPVPALKEQVRDVKAGARLDILWQDLRYAVRSLRRTPGFTLVTVLTLALGIGANAAIFALLDAVLLKPLPVPAPGELVMLYEHAPQGVPDASGGTGRYLRFSYPRFARLAAALEGDGQLAAATRSSQLVVRATPGAQPTLVRGQLVSGGFFDTLGVSAQRGRLIGATDAGAGTTSAAPVAVVSDGFWRRVLGGGDTVIGQTIAVNDLPVVVIGVAPPTFVGLWTDAPADVWLPLALQTTLRYDNNSSSYADADRRTPWVSEDRIAWLNLFGRLPASTQARARARLIAANQQGLGELAQRFADGQGRQSMLAHTLAIEPLTRGFSGLRARYADALVALGVLVMVVLLVTCANVANLLLTRAAGRARDIGVRVALGASTGRLLSQHLVESLLLAAIGGLAGLIAGVWTSTLLAHQVLGSSRALPPVFTPDARVLLFTAVIALATALACGMAPALRAIRLGRTSGFAANQRETIGRATLTRMQPLVIAQLALSVAVVFAAVLLGRTLLNITRLDPGFAVDRLVSVAFDAAASGYPRAQLPAITQRLVDTVDAVPGVTSAAAATCGLLINCSYSSGVTIEGVGDGVSLRDNWVGRGYFAAVGMPLVAGREFDARETATSARTAVITQSVAERYFGGQNPIGRRLGFTRADTEIIGVVRDARVQTLHEPSGPTVYFPIEQPGPFQALPTALDVRVTGDPARMATVIRETLRLEEPALVLGSVSAMSVRVSDDASRERLVAYLAAAFALLSLFLAALGLYGVLSHAVAGRTKEIGVRVALGARASEIRRLVVAEAAMVIAIGVGAGILTALATGRLLRTLLFGVSPSDPITYAVVLGVLAATTLVATYLPARRAARMDPVRALRGE